MIDAKMRMPKGFSLCGLCLLMFTILDIKMERFKTLIHFKNNKHVIFNMNNIFLMKATINSKRKMFREKNGIVSQFCKSLHCLAEEKSAGFS